MGSPIGREGGASPGPRIAISEGLECLLGSISNEVWSRYISTCDGGTLAHQGRVGGVAQRRQRPEQTQAALSDRAFPLPKTARPRHYTMFPTKPGQRKTYNVVDFSIQRPPRRAQSSLRARHMAVPSRLGALSLG